jgi:hypothetical protein
MSLINDALKKAQKLQMEGQAPPPPNPGSAPSTPGVSGAYNPPASSGRNPSMPGQLFMLMAFGAGALIALSVLATVYLLRHPAAPSPTGAAAPVVAQAPVAPSPTGAATPVSSDNPVIAPVTNTPPPAVSQMAPPPAPAQNSTPAPAPALEKFTLTPPTIAPAVAAAPTTPPAPLALSLPAVSLPAVSLPALSLPAVSLPNPSNEQSDSKILAYLDALQIAGIRVSDTGSKVLMNDRVFREGEIVDHLLGLRLKKVESDTLTFVDDHGVIYTKNF